MTDLDLTFNPPNGFLTTSFNAPPQDNGISVCIRSDGRIIMGGYSTYTSHEISLACYNTDGSLYTLFGGSGTGKVSHIPPSGSTYIVNDVILQSNNYILVTGNLNIPTSLNLFTPSLFVARFTDLGAVDTSFGTAGYVITNPQNFNTTVPSVSFDQCYSNSLVLNSSNDIIITGHVRRLLFPSNPSYLALVKYNTNGFPVNSFGTNNNGTVYTIFNTANSETGSSVDIQSDGKIVITGISTPISTPTQSNFIVARYNVNGTVDTTTFNPSNGFLLIPQFFPNSSDNTNCVKIDSNGRIIIGGFTTKTTGESCMVLACVTSSGALDLSFAGTGKTVLDLTPTYNLIGPGFGGIGNSITLQTDNKIVITGAHIDISNPSQEGFALARFNTDGSLDTTFGIAGVGYILSDLVSPNSETGYSVAIQTDGKILVGGTAIISEDSGQNSYFILARYFYTPVPPDPIVPICFPAGTPVLTDQGYIPIEKIQPNIHTINNKSIVAITKTITPHNKLVCFEKHSLGINVPSQNTYISMDHGIIYRNKLIKASKFVGHQRGVYYVRYDKRYLYNVLMKRHNIMIVNNMKVETLDPVNIVAKLYANNYTIHEKIKLISKINEHSNKLIEKDKISNAYNKFLSSNYTRHNNYKVHRYNTRYSNLFFTRRIHKNPNVHITPINRVENIIQVPEVVVETPKIELQKSVISDDKNTINNSINIRDTDNINIQSVDKVDKVENIIPIKPKISNLNLNKKTAKRIILPVGSKTRLNIFTHKNGVNRYISNKNRYRK
jgi:uncharacterized delta-60 repeat protein